MLDISYALSHGLLQLSVFDEGAEQDVQIDTSQLRYRAPGKCEKSRYILSSPVERKGNWREHIGKHYYHIDPDRELALFFELGKTYTIRIVKGCDFGGDPTYPDLAEYSQSQSNTSTSSEIPTVICKEAEGQAIFTVVPSLPWPSRVQTQMRWTMGEGNRELLEVTVSNMGTEAITVQTRGHQH